MKVVFADQPIFTDYAPYLDLLRPLEGKCEIAAYDESPVDDETRYERLKDAEVILFGVYKFENDFLGRLDKLKMLQFMGTGYTTFADVGYCARSGIIFTGIEDYGSNAVAEYAMAQVFTLARKTARADRYMREGRWIYEGLEGIEIEGSTFGVFGTGNIGRLVAKKAHALGAKVIASDIYESDELKNDYGIAYVGMEELFERSDILSVHLKSLPTTKAIVSEALIGKMKPGALFVNCSRAEVVDNEALECALLKGNIGGAAFDVFNEEPLRDFSGCRLPNVITSPHIGFFTGKAKENCLRMCIDSVVERMRL